MRNLHFVLLAWTFGSLALQANTAGSSLSVYDMPRLWPRHCQLRQELIGAIRRGDIQTMEATCRAALELMPTDATWRYNLAKSPTWPSRNSTRRSTPDSETPMRSQRTATSPASRRNRASPNSSPRRSP